MTAIWFDMVRDESNIAPIFLTAFEGEITSLPICNFKSVNFERLCLVPKSSTSVFMIMIIDCRVESPILSLILGNKL